MAEINGGKELVLESSINRKWNVLTFFIVVSIISFSPMLFAGPTYWDVQTGVYFRATTTGGDIDFDKAIMATQIRVVSGLVEFAALTMDGDYISLIGMSASSNCDMTLLDIEADAITYEVTANAGQTSTTRVKVPSDIDVYDVSGATAWAFNPSTRIATISVLHASTQQIELNINSPSSLLIASTTNTIDVIFGLQTFILVLSIIASLGTENPKNTALNIIIGNVIIFMMLRWIEGII